MNISAVNGHLRAPLGIHSHPKTTGSKATQTSAQTTAAEEFQSLLSNASSTDSSGPQYLQLGNFQPPKGLPDELKSYDSNQDGQIGEDEFAAVDADLQSGKLQLPPPPEPRSGNDGTDGLPDPLKSYDLDQSGDLNDTELKSVFEDIQSGKLQPPPPPKGKPNASASSASTGKLSDDSLKMLLEVLNKLREQSKTDSSTQTTEISSTKQLANLGYSLISSISDTV